MNAAEVVAEARARALELNAAAGRMQLTAQTLRRQAVLAQTWAEDHDKSVLRAAFKAPPPCPASRPVDPRDELLALLDSLVGKQVDVEEIAYRQKRFDAGFQVSVTLEGLGGGRYFGEVCSDVDAAAQSAAKIAAAVIRSEGLIA